MLALLAKLQRRSLDQLLKIGQQTTNLRRNLILPLCGITEVAKPKFKTLTLVGHDLFAGSFQSLVTDEAARRDSLKKTTFDQDKEQGKGQPFHDFPRPRGRRGGRNRSAKRQRVSAPPSATAAAATAAATAALPTVLLPRVLGLRQQDLQQQALHPKPRQGYQGGG